MRPRAKALCWSKSSTELVNKPRHGTKLNKGTSSLGLCGNLVYFFNIWQIYFKFVCQFSDFSVSFPTLASLAFALLSLSDPTLATLRIDLTCNFQPKKPISGLGMREAVWLVVPYILADHTKAAACAVRNAGRQWFCWPRRG